MAIPTLLHIDYEIHEPDYCRARIFIGVDDEWSGELYGDGTYAALLTELEHVLRISMYSINVYGEGPSVYITRATYGDLDLLAQGIEFWTKEGNGTVELVEGQLKITSPKSEYTDAIATLPAVPPQDFQISFNWEVSSEQDYDFLEGFFDETLMLKKSGLDSGVMAFTIPSGQGFTLRFMYVKDSSWAENEDCGRVGNIVVGGENWLANGLEGWILGGDVLPVLLPDGRVELKCLDDQSSWMERTYVPPPDQIITNIRIRHMSDGQPISQFAVEALDTFFIDAVVEGFDLVTGSWIPVEPTLVEARLERYDETGLFEQISDSQVFAHPDDFFRLLQKCNAPPGTYYLKTTATFGSITQIERLKIKARANI